MKKILSLFLILTTQVLAACEAEHSEALEYEGKCNTARDITTACGITAAATFVFHFGLGGALCAAPAASASEICKLKDQRWEKYNSCIALSIQREQEEAKKKENAMIAMLDEKAQAELNYYEKVDEYIKDLNDRGIDPESDEMKDEVRVRLKELKDEYDRDAKEIEVHYQ